MRFYSIRFDSGRHVSHSFLDLTRLSSLRSTVAFLRKKSEEGRERQLQLRTAETEYSQLIQQEQSALESLQHELEQWKEVETLLKAWIAESKTLLDAMIEHAKKAEEEEENGEEAAATTGKEGDAPALQLASATDEPQVPSPAAESSDLGSTTSPRATPTVSVATTTPIKARPKAPPPAPPPASSAPVSSSTVASSPNSDPSSVVLVDAPVKKIIRRSTVAKNDGNNIS